MPFFGVCDHTGTLLGAIERSGKRIECGHFVYFDDVMIDGIAYTASGAEDRIHAFHSVTLYEGAPLPQLDFLAVGWCIDRNTFAMRTPDGDRALWEVSHNGARLIDEAIWPANVDFSPVVIPPAPPRIVGKFAHRFKLLAKNAGKYGSDVTPGVFIQFREGDQTHIGRVLTQPLTDGCGAAFNTPHVEVIGLSEDLHFGYIHYVDLNAVVAVIASAADLMAWFFSDASRDVEKVRRLDRQGAISNTYIAKYK